MGGGMTLSAWVWPEGHFNKRMALDVIEDALTTLDRPEDRGLAIGLCGAFYMCGLLTHAEWQALLARIPGSLVEVDETRIKRCPDEM